MVLDRYGAMTKRNELLDWAKSQVGPGDRAAYWRSALGYDPGEKLAWCGAFCLAGLHAVGLAIDTHWRLGVGFVGPLGLHTTRTPSRGDIGYLHIPFQHHFLFDREQDGWIYSVDGNQPGVLEKRRRRDGLLFYSIEPLLDAPQRDTDPAPPMHPVLKLGASGADVLDMQNLLNRVGAHLKPDGQFGPVTSMALQSFQRRAGLDADGVCGPKTWGALLLP